MRRKGSGWIGCWLAAAIICGASLGCRTAPIRPDAVALSSATVADTFRTGAEVLLSRPDLLAQLRGQRIGIVANHTALVYPRVHGRPDTTHPVHLVDTLRSLGLDLRVVFAPEHGFRGEAEAGAHIQSGRDARTGLPLVSLYGATKKPTAAMLFVLDVVLFDIQDVGARFYTYLSTLAYVQEACAEHNKRLWVLDRPNPNGDRVGGPVLDTARQRSFVGLHPIPILHGMTLGEYARLLNGTGWLAGRRQASLTVVPLAGWTHATPWAATGRPWVAPSPNLPTVTSARLYPFLCWYEGTPVSVGRGTSRPFEQTGLPSVALPAVSLPRGWTATPVGFTPQRIAGKAENPPHKGLACTGWQFALADDTPPDSAWIGAVQLLATWHSAQPDSFFVPFFHRLSGTASLAEAIQRGDDPAAIVQSWQAQVAAFQHLRTQYLLYP